MSSNGDIVIGDDGKWEIRLTKPTIWNLLRLLFRIHTHMCLATSKRSLLFMPDCRAFYWPIVKGPYDGQGETSIKKPCLSAYGQWHRGSYIHRAHRGGPTWRHNQGSLTTAFLTWTYNYFSSAGNRKSSGKITHEGTWPPCALHVSFGF